MEDTSGLDHKSHKSHKSKKSSARKTEEGESSRRHDRDNDEKRKKRHRDRDDGRDDDDKSRKHKHKRSRKKEAEIDGMKVIDASDDEDVWVEKNIDADEVCLVECPVVLPLTRPPERSHRHTDV